MIIKSHKENQNHIYCMVEVNFLRFNHFSQPIRLSLGTVHVRQGLREFPFFQFTVWNEPCDKEKFEPMDIPVE